MHLTNEYTRNKEIYQIRGKQHGFTEGRGADLMITNLVLIQEIA